MSMSKGWLDWTSWFTGAASLGLTSAPSWGNIELRRTGQQLLQNP